MNLKEVEYIVKIAEEKNISRAAEKLYLTPSALSQQLLNLEREVGTPLFFRSRTSCTPTRAGEAYLETARKMLCMKKETYHRIRDIADIKQGILQIGFPPERGTAMFTQVYPVFHQRYPKIVINVKETSVRTQQRLIAKGELDVGFVTLRDFQRTADTYQQICTEELVLVVPSGHPACKKARPGAAGGCPELPVEEVLHEPFALMYKESTIYECISQIFRQAGFFPDVLFETARACTILEIVAAGMCCSIVPYSESILSVEGVAVFAMPDHPTWNIMALYKKGSCPGRPAKDFVSLAAEYWKQHL